MATSQKFAKVAMPTHKIIGVCVFGFLAIALCYADRIIISVAIIPMANQFGWSLSQQGFILSTFFIGYLLTQIIGGKLADRYGGEKLLLIAVVIWSLFTAISPVASFLGIWALAIARIGMGLGEGVSFPSIYSFYGQRLPETVRSRAITSTMSGIPFGSVVTLIATPFIIASFGWQSPFYLFAALGLLWALAWRIFLKSLGSQSEKLGLVGSQPPGSTAIHARPTRELLKSNAVWAIIIAHFAANWTGYVLLAWMPKYVSESLDVNFATIGLFAMVPYVFSFIAINFSGWVADFFIRRKMNKTTVRKLITSIGFSGSAAALFLVGLVDDPYFAIGLVSIGVGFGAFGAAGFGVNHLDLAPNDAGALMGLSNTAGTIPGIVGVYVTGAILDSTGSWAMVFSLAGIVSLVGLSFYLAFGSAKRQF